MKVNVLQVCLARASCYAFAHSRRCIARSHVTPSIHCCNALSTNNTNSYLGNGKWSDSPSAVGCRRPRRTSHTRHHDAVATATIVERAGETGGLLNRHSWWWGSEACGGAGIHNSHATPPDHRGYSIHPHHRSPNNINSPVKVTASPPAPLDAVGCFLPTAADKDGPRDLPAEPWVPRGVFAARHCDVIRHGRWVSNCCSAARLNSAAAACFGFGRLYLGIDGRLDRTFTMDVRNVFNISRRACCTFTVSELNNNNCRENNNDIMHPVQRRSPAEDNNDSEDVPSATDCASSSNAPCSSHVVPATATPVAPVPQPPSTVRATVAHWMAVLQEAEVSEPELSAQYITAHVLRIKRPSLPQVGNQLLTAVEQEELQRLFACRLHRMPIQYIVGNWDFHFITLDLWPPVLIPRPETEELVDLVLELLEDPQPFGVNWLLEGAGSAGAGVTTGAAGGVVVEERVPFYYGGRAGEGQSKRVVLDLCCGSGAISLAVLNANVQVDCVAVDQSSRAIALARHNAAKLSLSDRLTLVHARVAADAPLPLPRHLTYDLVVANPPYVPTADIKALQKEIVLYEDLRALDGGADGMDLVKLIVQQAGPLLKQGGHLVMEVDSSHGTLLADWLQSAEGRDVPLRLCRIIKDMSGRHRFLHLVKACPATHEDDAV